MTNEKTQAVRWGRALGSAFLTDAPYLTTHLGLLGPVLLGDVSLVVMSVSAYLVGRLLPYLVTAPARVADHWHRSELRRRLPHASSLALLLAAVVLMAAGCGDDREAARDDGPECRTSPMTTLPGNSLIGSAPLLGNSGVRPTGFRDGRLGLQEPAAGNLFAGSEFWGAKVLWVVIDPASLPVRISGRGPGSLRFNGTEGEALRSELTITEVPQQGLPSYVRIDKPGCYELYLDAPSGRSALTFVAEFA